MAFFPVGSTFHNSSYKVFYMQKYFPFPTPTYFPTSASTHLLLKFLLTGLMEWLSASLLYNLVVVGLAHSCTHTHTHTQTNKRIRKHMHLHRYKFTAHTTHAHTCNKTERKNHMAVSSFRNKSTIGHYYFPTFSSSKY